VTVQAMLGFTVLVAIFTGVALSGEMPGFKMVFCISIRRRGLSTS